VNRFFHNLKTVYPKKKSLANRRLQGILLSKCLPIA
jgi:hypothetical protein